MVKPKVGSETSSVLRASKAVMDGAEFISLWKVHLWTSLFIPECCLLRSLSRSLVRRPWCDSIANARWWTCVSKSTRSTLERLEERTTPSFALLLLVRALASGSKWSELWCITASRIRSVLHFLLRLFLIFFRLGWASLQEEASPGEDQLNWRSASYHAARRFPCCDGAREAHRREVGYFELGGVLSDGWRRLAQPDSFALGKRDRIWSVRTHLQEAMVL